MGPRQESNGTTSHIETPTPSKSNGQPLVDAKLRYTGVDTTTGSLLERTCGLAAISIFTSCFWYSTLYPLAVCGFLVVKGFTWWRAAWLLPVLLSLALPAVPMPRLLALPILKTMLKYHDYEEILEISDEDCEEMEKTRKCIYACQPHGVMSVAGCVFAVSRAPKGVPPSAVASVLLRIPFLKQVFGSFGLLDASRKSVMKALKKHSIVLYPGGLAELFISSPVEEKLYIHNRKGFIKLAMQAGADVTPVYFFGNTTSLEVVSSKTLASISRALGVSITLYWGRWGLPIPLPRKILCVRGVPLGLPKTDSPTDEQVTKWHAKYVSEVTRLFDTYKGRAGPDYAHKSLIFPTEGKSKTA